VNFKFFVVVVVARFFCAVGQMGEKERISLQKGVAE
jgi:hypothetical protein